MIDPEESEENMTKSQTKDSGEEPKKVDSSDEQKMINPEEMEEKMTQRQTEGSSEEPKKVDSIDDHKLIELNTLVIRNNGITINSVDIQTLIPGSWLNDKIINVYFKMIQAHNQKNLHQHPKIMCMDVFHYQSLSINFERTKEWVLDVFSADLVFFPINISHHWILVVVDFVSKAVTCFDSMKKNRSRHSMMILKWPNRCHCR